jgi:hypothetical protein
MQLVDRNTAVGIIRELAQAYVEAHGEPPRTIIAVGDSALSLQAPPEPMSQTTDRLLRLFGQGEPSSCR